MPFDRGDRTYYVSDERLKAFKALSTEEKLRWLEELATFLLMSRPAQQAGQAQADKPVIQDAVTPPSA